MMASAYGSRQDLLPRMMAKSSAVQDGLKILSFEESRALEDRSINRFRARRQDTLDWENVEILDAVEYEDETDAVAKLASILAVRAARGSELVVFWGTLALPSVQFPVRIAGNYLPGIVEVAPQFWVFLPAENYLVECLPDGQVTGGLVPH